MLMPSVAAASSSVGANASTRLMWLLLHLIECLLLRQGSIPSSTRLERRRRAVLPSRYTANAAAGSRTSCLERRNPGILLGTTPTQQGLCLKNSLGLPCGVAAAEPKALKNETWRTFILHCERETPDGMNRGRR